MFLRSIRLLAVAATSLLLISGLSAPAHAVQDPAGGDTGTPPPDPGTGGWVGPDPIDPVSTGDLKVNLLMIRAGVVPSSGSNAQALPDMRATGSVAQEASSDAAPAAIVGGTSIASPWLAWSDIRGGAYEDNVAGASGVDGSFAQATLGLGYALTDTVTTGIALSFEHLDEDERGSASSMNGNGFAVGPFLAAALSDSLTFETRAQWGWSSAEVREDTVLTILDGTRETQRMLLEARLSSEQDLGPLHLVPDLTFFLGRDHYGSYKLSDGVNTAQATAATEVLGRASAGLRIAHDMDLGDATLSPFVSARLSWDFKQVEKSADAVRSTLGAGLTYSSGATVAAAGVEWDGVSTNGLETLSAKVSLTHAF